MKRRILSLISALVFSVLTCLAAIPLPASAAFASQQEASDTECTYDPNNNPNANGSAPPSTAELKSRADACKKGFSAALEDGATAPRKTAPYGPCYSDSKLYKNDVKYAPYCHTGYVYAYQNRSDLKKLPKKPAEPTAAEKKTTALQKEAAAACQPEIPGASNSDALLQACVDGYVGSANGKTVDKVCPGTDINGQFCTTGFQLQQNAGGGGNSGSGGTSPDCTSGGLGHGDPLNWILCPIFDAVAGASDFMFKVIVQPLLHTTPLSTDPASTSYQTWSNFRIYGNIFLVIALLVVVFGQSIGGGVIDAYTAKKVLPRLLLAVILINLSLYIVALMVDVTNIVGGSLGSLITDPLKDAGAFKITPSGVQAGTIFTSLGVGALLVKLLGGIGLLSDLFSFALLFIIFPVFMGLLAAFVTLILRQAIILALVMVSPVAFALYCLPNTEKYFRKWWDFLVQTLMVYPIVIVFFAISDVLSVTLYQTGQNGNPVTGSLAALISFTLQFLPLLFIPYSFRLAGGALGRLHDGITTYNKRGQEAIKGNVNDPNSLRNKTKRRANAAFTAREANILNAAKAPGSGRGRRTGARLLNAIDGRVNERQSRFTKEAADINNMISGTGNDDDHYAANWFSVPAGQAAPSGLTSGGASIAGSTAGHERFFNSKGKEINETYAKMSENKLSANNLEAGRSLEYPVRKALTDDDLSNFRRGFAATAVRQNLNTGEVIGMHAASTFEHKDKSPELWYGTPEAIKDARGRTTGVKWNDVGDNTPEGRKNLNTMTSEMYNSRQSFQLGSIRSGTVRSMETRRNEIMAQMDAGTPISSDDAKFFAETDGMIEALVQRGVLTKEGEAGAEMSVSGASAATQEAVKAVARNRRYGVSAAKTGAVAADPLHGPTPIASTNERVIFHEDSVNAAVRASIPTGGTTPTLSRDAAIQARRVNIAGGHTVQVTGDADRSTIPRSA